MLISRRDFVKFSAITGVTASTVPTLLTGCRSSSPMDVPVESTADTVYRNGTVYLDVTTKTDTIAIANGKVIATGSDVAATVKSSTTIVDLAGGFAWPGFHDSHIHFMGGSFLGAGVRLGSAMTMNDMRTALLSWIGSGYDPGAGWIFGSGWSYDTLTPDAINSTALDVDPVRPVVFFDTGGHSVIANSAALALAGITDATPDPSGGTIYRVNRHANGLLQETATKLVLNPAMQATPDSLFSYILLNTLPLLAAAGVTGLSEILGTPGLGFAERERIYRNLESQGKLSLRVHYYVPVYPDDSDEQITARLKEYQMPSHNSDLVRFAGGKIWIDGGFDTGGALTSFEHKHGFGSRTFLLNRIIQVMDIAEQLKIPFQIHANGDVALSDALTALETIKSKYGGQLQRHVIVHFSLTTPALWQRIKQLGLSVAGQPIFWEPGGFATELTEYGYKAYDAYNYPAAEAMGIPMGYGTDWPAVDNPLTDYKPMKGLATCTSLTGRGAGDTRLLTATQFLHGYTAGSAYTVARSDLGHLRIGALADIVVFGQNPLTTAPNQADKIPVTQVWVNGKKVLPA